MSNADVETRKFLNMLFQPKPGDAVEYTYQGQKKTGHIDAEIINLTQYKITHPWGGVCSVWREYIHKKVARVIWPGLAESLFQHALLNRSEAITMCNRLHANLTEVLRCGNQQQIKQASALMRAVNYAIKEIEKHVEG